MTIITKEDKANFLSEQKKKADDKEQEEQSKLYWDHMITLAVSRHSLGDALNAIVNNENAGDYGLSSYQEALVKGMIAAALIAYDPKIKIKVTKTVELLRQEKAKTETTVSFFDLMMNDGQPPAAPKKRKSRAKAIGFVDPASLDNGLTVNHLGKALSAGLTEQDLDREDKQ